VSAPALSPDARATRSRDGPGPPAASRRGRRTGYVVSPETRARMSESNRLAQLRRHRGLPPPEACPAGHPFVPGSFTVQTNGKGRSYRICCECNAARARAWRARQPKLPEFRQAESARKKARYAEQLAIDPEAFRQAKAAAMRLWRAKRRAAAGQDPANQQEAA